MATASTVNHQSVPVPAPDVPRNLANLAPEILQMIFRIVLSGATIFCPCDMFSVNTKKHDLHGDWIILLACRRFQREGLPTWYRVVTMEFGRFYPAHSPTSQLDHCEKIKLGPHLGPGPPLSTNLQRFHLTRFLHLKEIELPPLTATINTLFPDDRDILE